VKHFSSPNETLGSLEPEAAAKLIAAAADVALVIDANGIIRDVSLGNDKFAKADYANWLGRPWADTVTSESRPKVEALLRDASSQTPTQWRHVNHATPSGEDIPVLYSTIRVGRGGRAVAVGRDLRDMSHLQQQLVDAQQAMERDYWKLRHAETRYRLLFEMSSEAVLIVDAADLKVLEANPAACRALGESPKKVVGHAFPIGLDARSEKAVQTLLSGIQMSGRGEDVRVRTADGKREFTFTASIFRQENASLFLLRLSEIAQAPQVSKQQNALLQCLAAAPDGFVVTDLDGHVIFANTAFLTLAELATEAQARGASLERWLGQPGVHLDVLIANLRQHGTVRLFNTSLRGEYGARTDVEISAVAVPQGEQPCLGFTIRNIDQRLSGDSKSGRELPRSVEQLTSLIGRVPLKDLVREATDLIERLCIEAALDLTNDNRASAAEMLGLSRQSLYVKLRRYGISDINLEPDDEN
jgi:transcriptional regulator PpsR